jgi:hypothetical protein
MRPVLGTLVCVAAMTLTACRTGISSPDGSSTDAASAGVCSSNVPQFQACNTLANIAPVVTPTCVTGAMPTGTGGTIVEGTYVLTSQTWYNDSSCDTREPGQETIVISSGCYQAITTLGTSSVSFVVQDNNVTSMLTCSDHVDIDGAGVMFDVHAKTFTATPTTYTLFTPNSAAGNPNPDRVEVFTKR